MLVTNPTSVSIAKSTLTVLPATFVPESVQELSAVLATRPQAIPKDKHELADSWEDYGPVERGDPRFEAAYAEVGMVPPGRSSPVHPPPGVIFRSPLELRAHKDHASTAPLTKAEDADLTESFNFVEKTLNDASETVSTASLLVALSNRTICDLLTSADQVEWNRAKTQAYDINTAIKEYMRPEDIAGDIQSSLAVCDIYLSRIDLNACTRGEESRARHAFIHNSAMLASLGEYVAHLVDTFHAMDYLRTVLNRAVWMEGTGLELPAASIPAGGAARASDGALVEAVLSDPHGEEMDAQEFADFRTRALCGATATCLKSFALCLVHPTSAAAVVKFLSTHTAMKSETYWGAVLEEKVTWCVNAKKPNYYAFLEEANDYALKVPIQAVVSLMTGEMTRPAANFMRVFQIEEVLPALKVCPFIAFLIYAFGVVWGKDLHAYSLTVPGQSGTFAIANAVYNAAREVVAISAPPSLPPPPPPPPPQTAPSWRFSYTYVERVERDASDDEDGPS